MFGIGESKGGNKMSKKFSLFVMVIVTAVMLAACGNQTGGSEEETEKLQVVTSFSILGDIAKNVTGDRADVEYIVPIGEEPHGYEPVPSDFQKVSDSDVFFVNGLGLEGWLERLAENVGDINIVAASDGIVALPIEGREEEDPHAWLDVQNVISYVEKIRDTLSELDPEGADVYAENAAAYIRELGELHTWIETEANAVPKQDKTIVISENAFKYFGEAYGFETIGIWELNSHEEGTPGQISRVVDLVQENELPAVFVETTVNKRFMEAVSRDSGVGIAGEVYTDAVGIEGSGAETYVKIMEHNVNTFVGGLSK